jgi:MFS transporter, DHA1 family, staphyloferrin A biosynthesis exporter
MKLPAVFTPLAYRNYRLYWFGNLVSQTGDWLDQIALNWLVVTMTDSPIWLALVNLGRGLPIIVFALIGGVFADKFDRRRMMMVTQSIAMCIAVGLSICVWYGASIWAIVALATVRGLVVAFNLPLRHSLVSDLVPRSEIGRAVAINSMTANTAKVVGPLLAASIIALFGLVVCFIVNALTFIVVLYNLTQLTFPERTSRPAAENFRRSLAGGLRYMRGDRTIYLLVLIAFIPTFFCQPFLHLMAVFAEDVFRVGATGLGVMTAAGAAGAVSGGLLSAMIQSGRPRGSAMIIFMGMFGLSVVWLAVSPSMIAALPAIFCAGAMQIAFNSSNNMLVQLSIEDDYRGRVLSMLNLTRGFVSLGAATMATLAAFVGMRWSMGLMATVVVVAASGLWLRSPLLRKLKR